MSSERNREFTTRPFASIEWLLIALVGASIAVSLWGFAAVPETARVPVNFNLSGEPTLTLGRVPGLLLMPLVQIGLLAIGWLGPRWGRDSRNQRGAGVRETRSAGERHGPRLYRVTFAAVTALLTVAHLLIVLTAAGKSLPVVPLLLTAIAICVVVIIIVLRSNGRNS